MTYLTLISKALGKKVLVTKEGQKNRIFLTIDKDNVVFNNF